MKPQFSPCDIADCMQLRTVATTLIKLRQNQTLNTLITTSCSPGEGKTSVAIQLAKAAALEARLRILLIDFNPNNPVLASLFDVPSTPGFSDYLSGNATVEEIIKLISPEGPDIVPYGSNPGGLTSRYEPLQLKEKLLALHSIDGRHYDLLVLDGPSSFYEPDLTLLGSIFDGIVLIIECERTRWEVVRHYQNTLREGNARLIGAVLNKRKYYIPKSLYV